MKLNILNDLFIKQKIQDMNICQFSYISVGYQQHPSSDIFGYFTNDAWMYRYCLEKLYCFDPLLEAGDRLRGQPIPWNSLTLITKKKASVMNLRYELAQVCTGMTLCTTTSTGVKRVLAIGDTCHEYTFLEKYQNAFTTFKSLCVDLDTYVEEKYLCERK